MRDLSPFLDVPIAHRGLHLDGVPENSLAAFAAACEAGVGIELDVHALADGSIAVFHDLTLERMCGVSGQLAELDAPALAGLRLAGTGECPPTLHEALELVDGRVPVMVEMKVPGSSAAGAVLAAGVARAVRDYRGPLAVLSFEPTLLSPLRTQLPTIPRGQLAASRRVPEVRVAMAQLGVPRWKMVALEHLAVAFISRPQLIGYDVRALPHPAVRAARRLGRPIFAGIATTPEDLSTIARYADGVCFDGLDPDLVSDRWRRRDAGARR